MSVPHCCLPQSDIQEFLLQRSGTRSDQSSQGSRIGGNEARVGSWLTLLILHCVI